MMKTFKIQPEIVLYDKVDAFCQGMEFTDRDIVFVSGGTYDKFFRGKTGDATVVNYRKYTSGEPTDIMVEAIWQDVKDIQAERIIAIGGGTILDVAKLFALKTVVPVTELFEMKISPQKDKELILVPTTCGTGSEVTNISILELTAKGTKLGLADKSLFADKAVLVPELLAGIPFHVFATSSIDALIHSVESFTSPKATEFTRMYSKRAMRIILQGYQVLSRNNDSRQLTEPLLQNFLLASTYAGIAFGNAGCAAVHAMSYPLGAKYHIPHGESNYVLFTEVYRTYQRLAPKDGIDMLNSYLAEILGCEKEEVYDSLESLLNGILARKSLSAYGITGQDIIEFTEVVMTKQGRLMSNNYTELSETEVKAIYNRVWEERLCR